MHPDFGSNLAYGIPYTVVPADQSMVPITFQYASESDPGPYPIPANPPIEGGNDHHILIVQSGTCLLYEIYSAAWDGSAWTGGSGAIWHLTQDWTRPANWTSADEAGLPILPGLIRYDEVQAGAINHALRFTVSQPQGAYVAPASHATLGDSTDPNTPPMGLRFRLRASFDVTPYPASVQVILRALQHYGMIVADTGADWYISGATDSRWNDDELHTLGNVLGSDFEVVQHGPLQYPQ